VYADTWDARDDLGRRLPDFTETGPPRTDRYVGLFYFLWLNMHTQTGPFDISRILAEHPNAMQDGKHPAWGPMGHFHHWGESVFGYYRSDDEYVFRKHAEMLADAGVDVVIFDVTNGFTYKQSYMALCRAFTEARADGVAAPAIAFLCAFGPRPEEVHELHRDLYGPGLYSDLWFRWEGKPLIMAFSTGVDPEVREFFTFRTPVPSYFSGPSGPDQWGWLEVHPQHVFRNEAGEAEQMTVGVAQNAVDDRLTAFSEPGSKGRSFRGGQHDTRPGAVNYGLNFAEQWERALEVDPQFIFITGWNEWVASRYESFADWNALVVFVDMFDQEGSRDIEPMKGGHGDNYYYQMIDGIRRFKGVRPQPLAGMPQSIAIDGRFEDWDPVLPEYRHHRGSTGHRNHPGWGELPHYVNTSGRNDVVSAKVDRDAGSLYFYVRTREALTPHTDPQWMMLFIGTGADPTDAWLGYDFVLNRSPAGDTLVVERSRGGWDWEIVGQAGFAYEGNQLELAIPRSILNLDTGQRLDIRFKWADNTGVDGDPVHFITHGEAAPGGRFAYRYQERP
jgi:hypothetical protein